MLRAAGSVSSVVGGTRARRALCNQARPAQQVRRLKVTYFKRFTFASGSNVRPADNLERIQRDHHAGKRS